MLGLATPGELALGEVPSGAAPEPTFESKYHQGWPEPVRERIVRGLVIALIASGATVPPIAPFPETVTESRWHQPWSEPVPVKPALAAAVQPFVAPDPLPRVSFSWWAWLSEPVRSRPALPVVEQHVVEFEPAPFVSFSWYLPLAEPVRTRWFAAAEQQALASPTPFFGAVPSGWDGPPPALVRLQYQAQARPPWPDISIAWYLPLAEPVRVRPALPAASQQVLAFDPQPFPFLGGGGGWYLPGSAEATPGKPDPQQRRTKKPGAPRQVEPAIAPPTFAETIAAQEPTRLADVLGSAFAPQLAALAPPTLDLYTPAFAVPASAGKPPPISRAVTDAAADHVDAIDAMEALQALDTLEQQEREAVIAILLHLANGNDHA
jgi:hypothetical protein